MDKYDVIVVIVLSLTIGGVAGGLLTEGAASDAVEDDSRSESSIDVERSTVARSTVAERVRLVLKHARSDLESAEKLMERLEEEHAVLTAIPREGDICKRCNHPIERHSYYSAKRIIPRMVMSECNTEHCSDDHVYLEKQ